MQVAAAAAAATGQPLLAPGPMPQFVPYPPAHPQPYQQPYHTQMVSVASTLNPKRNETYPIEDVMGGGEGG